MSSGEERLGDSCHRDLLDTIADVAEALLGAHHKDYGRKTSQPRVNSKQSRVRRRFPPEAPPSSRTASGSPRVEIGTPMVTPLQDLDLPLPPDSLAQRAPLRIRCPQRVHVGALIHGAWWPHTRDLAWELPALLDWMAASGFTVNRVSYDTTAWERAPRAVLSRGRSVALDAWITLPEAALRLVGMPRWDLLYLLVVPPQTQALVAERAMTLAALERGSSTATAILEAARASVLPGCR